MAPTAKQQIKDALGNKYVELDMSDVESIDSSGIDILMMLVSSVREKKGTVRIIGTRPYVREVMEICGLNNLVELS
jgi:anti-anti-sigma factor